MAAVSTTQLNDILPTFIVPAMRTQQTTGVMKKLGKVVPLPPGKGTAVNQPKFGTLTAYAGTDGVDVQQAQTLTTSNISATPGFIAVQLVLTDRVIRQASENVLREAGIIMGLALAKKLDTDLLTIIDGFSTIIPSSGNTGALAMGHLMAGKAIVRGNATEPGDKAGPVVGVVHEWQWHDIREDAIGLATGAVTYPIPEGLSGELARNYEPLGRAFGLDGLYLDNNIVTGTSGKAGVFARDSFMFVPHVAMGKENERDASLQAWELNVFSWYGYVELNDAWGVEVDGDCSSPTS